MVAVGCHILKEKCTKFDSGWGLQLTGLTALLKTSQLVLRGSISKGREGNDRRKGKEGKW